MRPVGGAVVTFAAAEEGVAAEVGDLHHHAVVHHTVGGLEAAVDLDLAGVEVRHALQGHREQLSDTNTYSVWSYTGAIKFAENILKTKN